MEIEIIKCLQSGANQFWDIFFIVITYMASFFAFIIIAIVFFLLFNKRYALIMSISFAISWALNEIVKLIIARPRPFDVSLEVIKKMNASNYSMPSGHSFTAMFLAGWLIYYIFAHTKNLFKRIISVVIVGVAVILVGISRMYLGVHYLSDVLVGFTYGIICVILSTILYKSIQKKIFKKKDNYGN